MMIMIMIIIIIVIIIIIIIILIIIVIIKIYNNNNNKNYNFLYFTRITQSNTGFDLRCGPQVWYILHFNLVYILFFYDSPDDL